MSIASDQARGVLNLGIGFMRCANGETYEFFLTHDGRRATNDVGVFRSVHTGDSLSVHAVNALKVLLERP